MRNFLLPLLFLPALIYAAIISDTVSLFNGETYCFDSASTTASLADKYTCSFYMLCSLKIGSTDIFISPKGFWDIFGCAGGCFSGIGSPRPFYYLKKDISQINLNVSLNLADSSTFSLVDTMRLGQCILPDTGVDWAEGKECFIVALARCRPNYFPCYVLCRFQNVYESAWPGPCCCPPPRYFSHFFVTWYLQTNGLADFRGVIISSVKPVSQTGVTKMPSARVQGTFSILGRKLNGPGRGITLVALKNGRIKKRISLRE